MRNISFSPVSHIVTWLPFQILFNNITREKCQNYQIYNWVPSFLKLILKPKINTFLSIVQIDIKTFFLVLFLFQLNKLVKTTQIPYNQGCVVAIPQAKIKSNQIHHHAHDISQKITRTQILVRSDLITSISTNSLIILIQLQAQFQGITQDIARK